MNSTMSLNIKNQETHRLGLDDLIRDVRMRIEPVTVQPAQIARRPTAISAKGAARRDSTSGIVLLMR